MIYNTGTIRQTHQRLHAEGMNISMNTLRVWVHNGNLPAAFSGKKAHIFYPNVLELLKTGCPQGTVQENVAGEIRKIG